MRRVPCPTKPSSPEFHGVYQFRTIHGYYSSLLQPRRAYYDDRSEPRAVETEQEDERPKDYQWVDIWADATTGRLLPEGTGEKFWVNYYTSPPSVYGNLQSFSTEESSSVAGIFRGVLRGGLHTEVTSVYIDFAASVRDLFYFANKGWGEVDCDSAGNVLDMRAQIGTRKAYSVDSTPANGKFGGRIYAFNTATSPPSLYLPTGRIDPSTRRVELKFAGALAGSPGVNGAEPTFTANLTFPLESLVYEQTEGETEPDPRALDYPDSDAFSTEKFNTEKIDEKVNTEKIDEKVNTEATLANADARPDVIEDETNTTDEPGSFELPSSVVLPGPRASKDFNTFVRWCALFKVRRPKVTPFFKPDNDNPSLGGYGVLATEPIRRGETLARVPVLLSRAHADPFWRPLIHAVLSDAPVYMREVDLLLVALQLAREHVFEKKSLWGPYLNVLSAPPTSLQKPDLAQAAAAHEFFMKEAGYRGRDHPGLRDAWPQLLKLQASLASTWPIVLAAAQLTKTPLDWLLLSTSKPSTADDGRGSNRENKGSEPAVLQEIPPLLWVALTQALHNSLFLTTPTTTADINTAMSERQAGGLLSSSELVEPPSPQNASGPRSPEILAPSPDSVASSSSSSSEEEVEEEEEEEEDAEGGSANDWLKATNAFGVFRDPTEPNPPPGLVCLAPFADMVRHGADPAVFAAIDQRAQTLSREWATRLAAYSDSSGDGSGSEEEAFAGAEELQSLPANSTLRLCGHFQLSPRPHAPSTTDNSGQEAPGSNVTSNPWEFGSPESGALAVELVALRDIEPGEEILRDWLPETMHGATRWQRQSALWLLHGRVSDI